MIRFSVAAALMLSFAGIAHAQAPSITIENGWARATSPAAHAGGAFLIIVDHGAPDRLVSASTPVAGMAQVHETVKAGDVMQMREVAGIDVTADKPVTFAPGGYHVMLMELKQPLVQGQSFPLTLHFAKAGDVTTTITIQGPGAAGPSGMKMDGMNMGGMKMPMPAKP